uniref:Uncharacterized protein n=1 Tax=Periophthalmus magnuspinnatus TaxID=409849 RepID=A0A3B4AFH2_9GOBI
MHSHQQGRSRHQDELKRPQPDVGNGEELVIADAVTAGLLRVTDKARLLVPPHTLCCNHQHQDSENENDRKPNASNSCRVPVYAADNGIKGTPVHFRLQV